MNRRSFLQKAGPLAVVPFFGNHLFASVVKLSANDAATLTAGAPNDRVLVVIRMAGGNDGLNTVLPYDYQTRLEKVRGNIYIKDTSLQLGSFQTGLHPVMVGLHSLYGEKHLTVVQSVSYDAPDFSHFRATEIWSTATDSNKYLKSGWLGRYLEQQNPAFPDGVPGVDLPADPLAIQIGSDLSAALQAETTNTGQTVPSSFSGSVYDLQSAYTNSTTPGTVAGVEVAFLRQQKLFANKYATRIKTAWDNAKGISTQVYNKTPSGIPANNLGQQLKLVAQLIKGGLQTKVYFVSMTSFDTHGSQVETTDVASHSKGYHASLLQELSDSIRSFQSDLNDPKMGLGDRVMGMTFSEFGRRIASNASAGTDHGVAAPMFVFGNAANPTVLGTNVKVPTPDELTTDPNKYANVPAQFDFRQVYRSIIQDWFCLPAPDVTPIVNSPKPNSGAVVASCSTPLPLTLVRFTVGKDATNPYAARLAWATSEESNVSHFEYQRSPDLRQFTPLGRVEAVGHSHELTNYEATDTDALLRTGPTLYYRLKMIDRDGTFSYSPTRSVSFALAADALAVRIFPNPATNGYVTILALSGILESTPTELTLTDASGRHLFTTYEQLSGTTPFALSLTGQPAGVYLLTVRHEGRQVTQKVVVE